MKKRWIAMGCAVMLVLSCFGCSSKTNEVATTEPEETVKTVETEEMIQKTQTTSASKNISAMEQIHTAREEAVMINADQIVTAEGVVDFTISSVIYACSIVNSTTPSAVTI